MFTSDCPKMGKNKANDETELVESWEAIMPSCITDVYAPVSCIERSENRERYVAEHRLDASKVIIVRATGERMNVLRAESDVMDILVLGCIPRKIDYCEFEDYSVLVREYVNGESLGGAITRVGIFSEDEVRTLGEDLCILISELYERNLSVKTSSLSARNIIISKDGRMRFVEPEGIEFCSDFTGNWNENEQAIGKLLNYLLSGDEKNLPKCEISKEFRKVLAKTQEKSGRNYGSVTKLLHAIEATEPATCRKRKGATGVVAVAAVLVAFILVLPLAQRIGTAGTGENTGDLYVPNVGGIQIDQPGIPASNPDVDPDAEENGDAENTGDEDTAEDDGEVSPEAEEQAK